MALTSYTTASEVLEIADDSCSIVGEPATSTRAPSPAVPSAAETHQVSGLSNGSAGFTTMDTEQLAETQPVTAASDRIVEQSILLGSVLFPQPSGPQDHIESGDSGAPHVLWDLARELPSPVISGPTLPARLSPDALNLELELLLRAHLNPAEPAGTGMPPTGENPSGATPSGPQGPSQNGHGGPATVIKRGK